MHHFILAQLNAFAVPWAPLIALVAVLAVILLISLIAHGLLHRVLLPLLRRMAEKSSRQWPKSLIDNKLFSRFALLMQGVFLQIQLELFLSGLEPAYSALMILSEVWIMVFGLLMFFSLLDIFLELSEKSAIASQMPLRGIFQSLKLIAALLVALMIISVLIGKSPLVLLTVWAR